ncbi:unnamed protein product [Discosporangium mesarthrocarpum]
MGHSHGATTTPTAPSTDAQRFSACLLEVIRLEMTQYWRLKNSRLLSNARLSVIRQLLQGPSHLQVAGSHAVSHWDVHIMTLSTLANQRCGCNHPRRAGR